MRRLIIYSILGAAIMGFGYLIVNSREISENITFKLREFSEDLRNWSDEYEIKRIDYCLSQKKLDRAVNERQLEIMIDSCVFPNGSSKSGIAKSIYSGILKRRYASRYNIYP